MKKYWMVLMLLYYMPIKAMYFNEITLDCEGRYFVDVDFDGIKEEVNIEEGKYTVYKINGNGQLMDVSVLMPYCKIGVHHCCEAHRSYTTFNYKEKTIYTEAHYGWSKEINQYRKVGSNWIRDVPVKPLSIINKCLFSQPHLFCYYIGVSTYNWCWGNYRGGFRYRKRILR